ncbi:MAG: hypothetical protein A4S14_07395 [Proteobacteria bacterium SG_bin9]|nr:MAG: hypothetical protein A4S14_07395 [Proteobacteria bacterium SG_bin9]
MLDTRDAQCTHKQDAMANPDSRRLALRMAGLFVSLAGRRKPEFAPKAPSLRVQSYVLDNLGTDPDGPHA